MPARTFDPIRFGNWILGARLGKGWTAAAVAERCKIDEQWLLDVEAGTRRPDRELVVSLSEVLTFPLRPLLEAAGYESQRRRELGG